MNKLSKTSKLDNILSWSLQALETCPGSLSASGVLVDACSGCYATTGCYSFKGTKAVRADNKAAWQEEMKLHDQLFDQLSYHLPKELVETKRALEKRLAS